MSDQPQALERSALEGKDRSELMTIATAMGGKPGSRAKKADIIDLIFQLAGVEPDQAEDAAVADDAAAPPAEAPAEAAQETPSRGGRGRGRPSGGADQQQARPEPDEDQDEAQRGGDGQGDDGGPRGGRRRGRGQGADAARPDSQPDDGAQGRQQGGRDQGGQKQGDGGRQGEGQKQGDSGRQGEGQKQGDSGKGGKQQDHDQGGQDGDGEPEPGNRRRRRRGRDRGGAQDDQPAEPVEVAGLLELRDEGYGFLRVNGFLPSKEDVYVSVKQTRQFSLRKGDWVAGASRPAARNEKNPALLRIDTVNGLDPDEARSRPRFENLTPLFPDQKLQLESSDDPYNMTARIIDLLAPIGKGQRGMIVSPPKAGKTTIMKQIARSIEANNPDIHLIVLLVDERPEEVTDMRRSVARGEVAASTFDRPPDEHIHVAELTLERAKRLVEAGEDVVVILDGITRLARAYNLAGPGTGRSMSGGVDSGALYPPKKLFGAARNIEEGGSLTILATALVETGSRMDEVIFEEFKGTGNMELKLDRRLSERRIFPAIDVDASSTRHEELLFDNKQLQQVWKLRRVLSGMASEGHSGAGIELLVDRMRSFKSNEAFLAEIAKGATGA